MSEKERKMQEAREDIISCCKKLWGTIGGDYAMFSYLRYLTQSEVPERKAVAEELHTHLNSPDAKYLRDNSPDIYILLIEELFLTVSA